MNQISFVMQFVIKEHVETNALVWRESNLKMVMKGESATHFQTNMSYQTHRSNTYNPDFGQSASK